VTDNEILEMLNAAVKLARPLGGDDIVIHSLDTLIKDTGLDSLDILMTGVYIADVYGVSDEAMKEIQFNETSTVRDFIKFMQDHKTKEPATLEEAMENIK